MTAPARFARPPAPAVDRAGTARAAAPAAALILLALLTVAAFSRAPAGGILSYDDENYVTNNLVVRGGLTREGFVIAWTRSYAGLWSPMTWLSLMLDVTLFGVDARALHAESLLLHVVNVLLLFLLLRGMTGTLWRSALVAALFAVHPLHVEPVAWISGRKDLISTLFGLATLQAYVRYARRRDAASYGLVTLALALGLASKSMLVTWPLLMLMLDFWPLGRSTAGSGRRLLLEKVPWAGMAAVVSVLTYLAQQRGGAVTTLEATPLAPRLANALWAYGAYLGKTVFPLSLSPFYPFRDRPLASLEVLAGGLVLGAIAVGVAQFRRRPWLAWACAWYVLSLAPTAGLVRVGLHAMADRFTYVPLVGPFLALAWAAAERTGSGLARRVAAGVSLSLVVGALAALTWAQVGHWRDDRSVFSQMVRAVDGNYFGLYHLAVLHEREGNLPEAERLYREALRADPRYGEPHVMLGVMLARSGREAEAVVEFREAVALGQGSPLVQYLLGVSLLSLGQPGEALAPLREALRMRPDFAEARNNLGVALEELGRLEEAAAEYRGALAIDPTLAQARENLALLEAARGGGSGRGGGAR